MCQATISPLNPTARIADVRRSTVGVARDQDFGLCHSLWMVENTGFWSCLLPAQSSAFFSGLDAKKTTAFERLPPWHLFNISGLPALH
jgi:hypothetical protein